MKVKITITAANIKRNMKNINDNFRCPIATALQKVVKKNLKPCVGPHNVNFHSDDDVTRDYDFPKAAYNFQIQAIEGKPVKPFSFTMNLPKDYLKETA